MTIQLFTIGFTKKKAETFFTRLREANVRRVIDVRLNNVSQLAGFAKKEDLQYFLKAIIGIDYVHLEQLAPTQSLLDDYKKRKGSWEQYAAGFTDLLRQRRVEDSIKPELLNGGCLLCSEQKPHHCHRRLVAEYLTEKWGSIATSHLE
jgi:uncharacterized protein (DUF488 family)